MRKTIVWGCDMLIANLSFSCKLLETWDLQGSGKEFQPENTNSFLGRWQEVGNGTETGGISHVELTPSAVLGLTRARNGGG